MTVGEYLCSWQERDLGRKFTVFLGGRFLLMEVRQHVDWSAEPDLLPTVNWGDILQTGCTLSSVGGANEALDHRE